MSCCDYIEVVSTHRFSSSKESLGEFHVAEEAETSIEIELTIVLSTIDEKVDGENRFCVSGEKPG